MLRRSAVRRVFGADWTKSRKTRPDPNLSFSEQSAVEAGGRAHHGRNRFQGYSLPVKIALSFVGGFCMFAPIEYFMCRTRLYDTVMMNKDNRRHEIDEFVVKFREDLAAWQAADMAKGGK